ncbi:EamA/RhaT family transporter [Rhodoferax lacus]|uniref:EamA/RhaT family transporter n=1 Tax=Rhodoferax lacus TaxID=2184758 RepID=A0A3E1RD16_9BURK|nr:DMT family transporter [Rhodoferax lacus]RFO97173.1 EamA/RhaT family transporter [Rhodoferax lacus]
MRPESQLRLARWAIWLIPLLWAVNYFVARKAPGVIEPYTLAFMRWGIAGLLLSIHARAELRREWRNIAAVWYQYVALGFCGMVVCGAWVYLGAQSTGAVNISLIYSASPVLIAVGSVLWLQERMRGPQVLGVVLALTGVLHVIVKGEWAALGQVRFVVGDAWIVAAMVSWAMYAMLQKLWPSTLGSTARLAATCWGAMPVLLAGTVWEMAQPGTPALTLHAWVLGLSVALLPGVGAYWIYGWAQKILGASKVAVTLYLGPLYGALLAWLVLGERLGWHHLVAAALILPGVFLVSSAGAAKRAA